MEFILKTDLEKSVPAVIDFNFEQLKSELAENLKKYESLVVTEDTVKDGKKKKSDLNHLKDALDAQRIAVKNKCMEPYTSFESKVRELTGMISQAVDSIDKQVKAFDEIKKQEKQEQIKAIYAANIGDLEKILPIEKMWNARWLNATYRIPEIENEIKQTIQKASNDIGIIKAMRTPCEVSMIAEYIKTLDMSAALAEKARYEELQKRIEERQKAKEAAATVNFTEVSASGVAQSYTIPRVACPETGTNAPEEPKTIKVIFYDTTAAFRHEMKALTDKHGIRYGGIN